MGPPWASSDGNRSASPRAWLWMAEEDAACGRGSATGTWGSVGRCGGGELAVESRHQRLSGLLTADAGKCIIQSS